MKKIKLFLTGLLLVITGAAFAQNITVTGTVTDASTKQVVNGATVLLQSDNTIWTTTDDQGFYSITVPSDGNWNYCLWKTVIRNKIPAINIFHSIF